MNTLIGKTPFFRLLIPVIAGIAAGKVLPSNPSIAFPIAFLGLFLMLISGIIGLNNQYRFRWLFGSGINLLLFSIALLQFGQHEESSRLTSSSVGIYRIGTISDIPEIKPRSIAVNLKTAPPEQKKIILYLEKTEVSMQLAPGDEIIFRTVLKPFKNYGNPDDFDYAQFMQNKGFAGSGYVTTSNWKKTGRQKRSIPIMAQRFRGKAINFYRSFELDNDAYAFICALTLGYKAHLSDDLQAAFRASGTAHILALSGLHVGIVYAVISLLFSFLKKNRYSIVIRQWLIITTLWAFVLVVGMTASVVRAAIMLTLYSIGNLYHKNGFSYNSLAAAAFLILMYRPFSLFDVGFQMSFGAVFAILFLNPKLISLYHPTNKIVKYIWNLFCITTSAQFGVFPFVLHYFGTFPTYFFIANMLVVPLVGIIIYATFPLIVIGLLRPLGFFVVNVLYSFFQWIEKLLVEILLKIVYISESIPFAQITDTKISFVELILLLLFAYMLVHFFSSRRSSPLIISMVSLQLFLLTFTFNYLTVPTPQLTVFNNPGNSEIAIYHDNKRHYVNISENFFVPHPEKRIFILSDAAITNYCAEQPFPIDILIITQQPIVSIEHLLTLFSPAMIVLDSSLPRYIANSIIKECNTMDIKTHDVTENGAFSLNF